jgi:hypothetical protein
MSVWFLENLDRNQIVISARVLEYREEASFPLPSGPSPAHPAGAFSRDRDKSPAEAGPSFATDTATAISIATAIKCIKIKILDRSRAGTFGHF